MSFTPSNVNVLALILLAGQPITGVTVHEEYYEEVPISAQTLRAPFSLRERTMAKADSTEKTTGAPPLVRNTTLR